MKVLIVFALCFLAVALGRRSKIVGGSNVGSAGKYKWQASLQFRSGNSHTCGASLISSRWLISAAHCVGSSASSYQIVLGLHDRTTQREGAPKTYGITRITSHPSWSNDPSRGFPNDISAIQISSSASMNNFVGTIGLPSSSQSFVGQTCVISGWGRVSGSGSLPNILKEADMEVLSQSECRGFYGNIITGYHTCVYDRRNRNGSCQGDSGGPLSCRVSGSWILAGATSFGVRGCPPSSPSVYASVPYFRNWIKSTTGA